MATSSIPTAPSPTPSPQATPTPNPVLVVDTEQRQDKQQGLQPKVMYAGDVWKNQPYIAAQQNSLNLYGSKPNGIVITDKFGTTISGPISFSTMPDQISIGNGYWRLNPLLLSSIPSTTATPVPILVKSTPQLLTASSDLTTARSNVLANSDAPTPTATSTSSTNSQQTLITQAKPSTLAIPAGETTAPIINVDNPPAPVLYTISVVVTGLLGTGLVLFDNGGDALHITGNGTFTFATALLSGSSYNITVASQPTGPAQFVSITNGMGLANADVTNVQATCTTLPTYTIGGTVSGLAGTGMIIQNNGGNNTPINANGSFTFSNPVLGGTVYNVTVLNNPASPQQTTNVTLGSGVATGNVVNVHIACTTVSLPANTTLAAQTAHNTSANAAYNKTNNAPDFTGFTWIDTSGDTVTVNSNIEDDSYNPITPCHMSPVSIKTMCPNYPGRFDAHVVPWFGQNNHTNIGVNCNTTAWAQASTATQQAAGFDGIIIDWYGPNRFEDYVTLKLQSQIDTMSGFSFAIMVDQGGYSTTAELMTSIAYVMSQYAGDSHYTTQNGKPRIYFFGTVAGVNYASVKTAYPNAYWISQGPSLLSWSDGCFDWVHTYGSGVPVGDPYNLTDLNSFLSTTHSYSAGVVPCFWRGFNGYVTGVAEGGYKKGYLTPTDSGKCWKTLAAAVNANIPTNCIGIQIPTWNDWEEGTAIETAIDNGITVTASVTAGHFLSWSVSGGTGDETIISSYTLLASLDGINATILGTQPAGGSHSFDLTTVSGWGTVSYSLYVVAVGIACVRSQLSNSVPYTA